jgi:hypothetical protein
VRNARLRYLDAKSVKYTTAIFLLFLSTFSSAQGSFDYVKFVGVNGINWATPAEACNWVAQDRNLSYPSVPGNPDWSSKTCGDTLGTCVNGNGGPFPVISDTTMTAFCCPGDKIYNGSVCVDPPPGCEPPLSPNPTTGQCELCPESRYAGETNVAYGMVEGECMNDINDCIDQGGMVTVDPTMSISGTSPTVVGCSPPPQLGCTNVTGKTQFNNFDYCLEREQECTASGGTYGAVGYGGGQVNHVCLQNYGNNVPTCASGSQYWIDDPVDGSSAFACVSTTPPNDVCDASKYDCDGDGNVDDQDSNGIVDNGGANVSGDGVTLDANGNPIEGNVGDDPLDPAVEGAGDCDPTSQNYQECISKDSPQEQILDLLSAEATQITSQYTGSDSVADSSLGFYNGLSSVPIVSAMSGLGASFTGSGECPAPSFSAFGTDFTMNYHCTLYSSISGMLSAVMFGIWTLLAARHLMSA